MFVSFSFPFFLFKEKKSMVGITKKRKREDKNGEVEGITPKMENFERLSYNVNPFSNE